MKLLFWLINFGIYMLLLLFSDMLCTVLLTCYLKDSPLNTVH